MGQQLGAVHSLRLINVRLSAGCRECSDAPLIGVPQCRQSRLLTGRGQEYAELDLLARVERELPVRLDQERPIWLFAMVIPACRTSWWTLNSSMHGSDRPWAARNSRSLCHLALMIANAEENWAAPDEAEAPSLSYSMYWGSKPPTANAFLLSAIGPSDLGLMFMPPVFLLIGTFRNLFSLRTPFPASFESFIARRDSCNRQGIETYRSIADELRGADYLVWRNGRGAAGCSVVRTI